jgi:hypothetical protein
MRWNALAAVFVPASAVQSAEIEGVRLPEPLQTGEAQLQRWGAGLPRHRHAFGAGVAVAYRAEGLRRGPSVQP